MSKVKIKKGLHLAYKELRALMRKAGPTQVVFIAGAQRSGTTIALDVFGKSPDIKTYGEGDPRFFKGYRLPSIEQVEQKRNSSKFPVIVAKPLVDSQHMGKWLAEMDGLKVIWMFRDFHQVVKSANRKWPGHQLRVMHSLAKRDWKTLAWRGENISEAVLSTFDSLYHPSINEQEGGALMWWLRNKLMFDQGLAQNKNFMLLDYEDMVKDSRLNFEGVFRWFSLQFDSSFTKEIHVDSLKPYQLPDLGDEIRHACDELLENLKNAYQRKKAHIF
ncbi:MAG: hypothetical protein C0617_15160 [Desulfuromonas sp.]|uniref:sulfotransferase domain-containing protein n=1 Tax=Desulfuromonas sp. TaxID=892 RepID=UPI000CC95316|nr:sulfotransferase domain-containing protein [Desulfuromonas sp.]PLX81999.1 MAG: hypothetical protein C0617_15160 [Desulfuromonas sp.]